MFKTLLTALAGTAMLASYKCLTLETPWIPLVVSILLHYSCWGSKFCCRVTRSLGTFTLFCTTFALLAEVIAAGQPLQDWILRDADAYLGMNATAIAEWCNSIRWMEKASLVAYFSMIPQMMVAILIGEREKLMRRMVVCGAVACAVFAIVPALGNYAECEAACHNAPIKQHMLDLTSGVLTTIRLEACEGIICAPSFHTIMGVLLISAFWKTKLRYGALALNLMMIFSTIPTGGHYVVDVIAGLMVAILVKETI